MAPPYVTPPSSRAGPFVPGETFVRSFHPSTYGDRFGFQEPTPIIPPGTEPDLHALNNLFVAAQREKERQLAASISKPRKIP